MKACDEIGKLFPAFNVAGNFVSEKNTDNAIEMVRRIIARAKLETEVYQHLQDSVEDQEYLAWKCSGNKDEYFNIHSGRLHTIVDKNGNTRSNNEMLKYITDDAGTWLHHYFRSLVTESKDAAKTIYSQLQQEMLKTLASSLPEELNKEITSEVTSHFPHDRINSDPEFLGRKRTQARHEMWEKEEQRRLQKAQEKAEKNWQLMAKIA